MLCSHFVLDTVYHLGFAVCIPARRGARARRRRCGAGSGPAAGLASLLAGGPWQPGAGPSLTASKDRVRGAVGLFPFPSNRAGLPRAPPSITPRAPKPWAYGCWLFETHTSFPRPSCDVTGRPGPIAPTLHPPGADACDAGPASQSIRRRREQACLPPRRARSGSSRAPGRSWPRPP